MSGCPGLEQQLERAQKLSKVGQPVYRVNVDRSGKKAVAPVLVKKSYQWQTDLFNRMVDWWRVLGRIRYIITRYQELSISVVFPMMYYPQYRVEEEDNLKKEQEFSKIDAIANLQKRLMK